MAKHVLKIIGIAAVIVVLIVFFQFRNEQSETTVISYDVDQPITYTEPLVVAVFDAALSILPKHAYAATKTIESETTVRYIGAYEKTDVVQERTTHKLKEDIILKEPGHPEQFTYQLNVEDFDWEFTESGDLEFYRTGENNEHALQKVFTIPAPFMIDDTGEVSSTDAVEMTLSKDGTLTLVPSVEWLAVHTYPVILDPTVEISVLNLHSHPSRGQEWVVDFTTAGTADLYIVPDDQATVDDDEFLHLKCDDKVIKADILKGDVIYVQDWKCDGVGHVSHYTLVAGNHMLRLEFGDQIAYAYNAATAGDYLIRRNDAETDSVTTSDLDAAWDTEVASSGSSISYSAGSFTLAAGKYLVMYSERFDTLDTTNNERVEIQSRLVIGGAATTTGSGQTYIRKEDSTAGDWQRAAIVGGSAILDIPSDSTSLVTRFYRTDTSSDAGGTVDRTADWGGITILALDDSWDYARYRLSAETATVDAFADVVWDHTVEEDTGFSMSSGLVTITDAGRYLVSYSIPITTNTGSDRTEYVTRIRLDDIEKTGTRVSTYMRQTDGTEDGVLSYVGIIDVAASDVLSVEMDATDGTITSDNMELGSSFQILQLPAGNEVIIAEATSGEMNPATVTEFAWDSTAHIDTDGFTMGAGTDSYFDVDVDGDYLFFATQATDNGGARTFPSARFSVNDTISNYAAAGQYNRSSTADDAGYSFGSLVTGLSATDDISLENLYIEVDQLTQTLNYGAISGLRLASIFSSNATPAISSVTDSPDPVAVGASITFSTDWSDADAGDNIKVKVCKSDSLTNRVCDGGHWATSTSFTTSDPEAPSYTAQSDDVGTSPNSYYVFVCDDEDACSSSTSGTFDVNAALSISAAPDTPDPVNPKRSVSWFVDWTGGAGTIKAKVCKTDSLTSQVCDGGLWASSTAFTTEDPHHISYDVVSGDWGETRNYYVFICDDSASCTSSTSGTFSVNNPGQGTPVFNIRFR